MDKIDYDIVQENGEFVVREGKTKYRVDLRKRLLQFAVDTIKFLGTIPYRKEFDVFRYQLSKSATSMGANYEESQGGYSYRDFASKIGICYKEARETHYFYKVIHSLQIGDLNVCKRLTNESDELKRIFGSILVKVKNTKNK